ncbi:hypothetical protein [Klebsiella quasipneumoniae]|uniref:hypothetical protein n=1 Tax=Klebsiella quasipneumoniae TaxID=1463165 RepID=UPI000E2AF1D1|nr:hypothetical protein [Klebsiella quasipneumoniae]SXD22857.1 Uncharacterised protein [Klebsiella quasipneumoniae]
MATITNLNAHALMNSAKDYIKALQETKTTMVKVVTDWNIRVAQSDMITYNFPVGEYKRKAHLIADFERVIEQLNEMAFSPVEAGEALSVCDSNDTQINNVSTTEEAVQMVNVLIATNATFRDVPDNGVFSQAGTSPLSLYSYFWKTPEGEAANTVESTALSMNLLPVQFNPDDRVQVWGVANTWESVNDLISAHVLASRRVYIQNETDAERLAAFALSLPQADLASFLRMIQTHCTEEFTSEVLAAFHASVEPEIQERLNSLLHTAQA